VACPAAARRRRKPSGELVARDAAGLAGERDLLPDSLLLPESVPLPKSFELSEPDAEDRDEPVDEDDEEPNASSGACERERARTVSRQETLLIALDSASPPGAFHNLPATQW
jgi:hypothetical protein